MANERLNNGNISSRLFRTIKGQGLSSKDGYNFVDTTIYTPDGKTPISGTYYNTKIGRYVYIQSDLTVFNNLGKYCKH